MISEIILILIGILLIFLLYSISFAILISISKQNSRVKQMIEGSLWKPGVIVSPIIIIGSIILIGIVSQWNYEDYYFKPFSFKEILFVCRGLLTFALLFIYQGRQNFKTVRVS